MITNKLVLVLCSLRPKLLEKRIVNGQYWTIKVFWLGKARIIKVTDKHDW